jgi:hypothetical protein
MRKIKRIFKKKRETRLQAARSRIEKIVKKEDQGQRISIKIRIRGIQGMREEESTHAPHHKILMIVIMIGITKEGIGGLTIIMIRGTDDLNHPGIEGEKEDHILARDTTLGIIIRGVRDITNGLEKMKI